MNDEADAAAIDDDRRVRFRLSREYSHRCDHHAHMTIISHKHRFIFLKTRKTGGTSIEGWLAPHLGSSDMIATAADNWPLPVPFLTSPNQTTRFGTIEHRTKRWIRRTLGRPKSLFLGEHTRAEEVRAFVGNDIWFNYFKFCVERHPLDRIVSFWRWRQKRFGSSISLDDFLDLMESDPNEPLVRNFSNLDTYMIDGEIVVDRIVLYENFREDLANVMRQLAVPASVKDLPHAKADIRLKTDTVRSLSTRQTDRISRLFQHEIRVFGFLPSSENPRDDRPE